MRLLSSKNLHVQSQYKKQTKVQNIFKVDNFELISYACLVFLLPLNIKLFARYGTDLPWKFRFIFRKHLHIIAKNGRSSLFCSAKKVTATLLKKRFWHRCFPANFAKF